MNVTNVGSTWHHYSKIWNIGHPQSAGLLDGPALVVEEKIDGSLFQCGIYDGQLHCASKGAQLWVESPEQMFTKAVNMAKSLSLTPTWCYRFEYLQKPKHNVLPYDRVPKGNLILLDVEYDYCKFLSPVEKAEEAVRLGVECVPSIAEYHMITESDTFDRPPLVTTSDFEAWLKRPSVLGGALIEGVVLKNYAKFDQFGHTLMGKYVSEQFKEVHRKEWAVKDQSKGDVVDMLIKELATPARWQKAIAHRRESGQLQYAPQDIGPLIKEIQADVKLEEEEYIKDKLFQWAWHQIARGVIGGFPDWYKRSLMEKALTHVEEKPNATTH